MMRWRWCFSSEWNLLHADVHAIDPGALHDRSSDSLLTAAADPVERDAELDLPRNLPIVRLREVASAGAVQP